ncbi:MAG: hypothetical protein RL701_2973, partial [Pseudomonadota bacterium]
MRRIEAIFLCTALIVTCSCGNVLGLSDYSVPGGDGTDGGVAQAGSSPSGGSGAAAGASAMPAGGCTTQRDCNDSAGNTAAGTAREVRICDKAKQQCVKLLSEDCQSFSGDYQSERAIIVGTMFATQGAQGSVNRARLESVLLAADEINQKAGGVPDALTGEYRPLVLVSCDTSQAIRAATHLVDDLHVPAIIGPNTSQDTLDVSKQVTVAKGTLVISPTAQASSIADLVDDDLTWQMVPNDLQRIALMIGEIARLETRLRDERKVANLKLAVIYRDDALGEGTFLALNSLQFNARALADPANLGTFVRTWPYAPTGVEPAIVDSVRQFAPDLVVLIGTTEAVVQGMVPLERAWTAPQRPEYMLIESSKTPELLDAVSGNAALRHRVRGTGALPAARSKRLNEAFVLAYAARHMDEPAGLFGMSQAYDAMFAVAFGIAAVRGPVTGRALAKTLPLLANSGMEIELLTSKTQTAFRMLAEGMPLTIVGTTAPLRWDDNGAVISGTIELWCISEVNGKPSFESSGLSLDLAS